MGTRSIHGSPFDPEGVVTDSKARPERQQRQMWRPASEEKDAGEQKDVIPKKTPREDEELE